MSHFNLGEQQKYVKPVQICQSIALLTFDLVTKSFKIGENKDEEDRAVLQQIVKRLLLQRKKLSPNPLYLNKNFMS
jgi:hypothetical protein